MSKIRSKKHGTVTPHGGPPKGGDNEPEVEVLPAEDPVVVGEDLNAQGGDESLPEVIDIGDASDESAAEDESREDRDNSNSLVPYSALDAYLAELRRLPSLSREEEHQVAVEYWQNKSPEAAKRLIFGSLWLVVKIARDYERVARNVLDLIQEGNIGLVEAVQNFDPYRGVRFPSYAVWWIRAYIIRYIIANWRLVKIGTTQAQRKLFFNLKKESDRLEREGIFPSAKLLADRLNVKEGDVIEMSQRLGSSDMSVDAPLKDESDSTLLTVLPSGEESIEDTLAKRELHGALKEAIASFEATLKEKELKIFKGRVLEEDRLTLQDLSDQLSISKERVRQIENRLRGKLKAHVANFLGPELDEWVDREKGE